MNGANTRNQAQKNPDPQEGVFQNPQPLSPRRVDNKFSARSSGFRIVLLPAPSHLLIKQWSSRVSFPVTAAGPRRFRTVFPLPKNFNFL